jgi:hypothetical protein
VSLWLIPAAGVYTALGVGWALWFWRMGGRQLLGRGIAASMVWPLLSALLIGAGVLDAVLLRPIQGWRGKP